MTDPAPSPASPLLWQPEKHLQDDARVWILTDIEVSWSSYYDYSPEQQWFRVGVYDLSSSRIGFAKFGRDLAFNMLKGGAPALPWGANRLPFGIELHRQSHGNSREGRFLGHVTTIELDPAILAIVPVAKKMFAHEGHYPNGTVGMWRELEARAKSENAIEHAALSRVDVFKLADIKTIVGNDPRIGRVLKNLVKEGRLTPVGKKKYMVTPPQVVARVDWTD